MMRNTTPNTADPIAAALAALAGAGISFTAVDRCADPTCPTCATRLVPAA